MFVRVANKLNAAVAALPGVPAGVAGGAVVAVSWFVTVPYGLLTLMLGAVLKLFPGESAKPLYKIGRNITAGGLKIASPLNSVWRQIDELRSIRTYRFWAVNLIALGFVALALYYLGNQISAIIADTDFEVITRPFNATLSDGFLRTESDDAIWVALLKGVANTLVLVVIAIFVASFLGLLVGVARLAKHPIISRFAAGYTELFRNVPLLALMLLLSAAVFLQVLPTIADAWNIPRVLYISDRGLAVPTLTSGSDLWWIWVICLFGALAAALYLRRLLIHKEQDTGNVYRPNSYSFLLFLGVAGVTYLILFFAFGFNVPVGVSLPSLDTETFIRPVYAGGFTLSTAFFAALIGLIFYFSAFIAEIVRGSIQAIPHGQSEAANSLGLSAYQRFTLVILPQALTIMIPSLNNEYQNVNKDSAVAFAIGYVETLFVLRQVANERGELVTLLIAGLLIYMFVNLIISAIMNTINRLNKVAR